MCSNALLDHTFHLRLDGDVGCTESYLNRWNTFSYQRSGLFQACEGNVHQKKPFAPTQRELLGYFLTDAWSCQLAQYVCT
jgi:hypothetical protein